VSILLEALKQKKQGQVAIPTAEELTEHQSTEMQFLVSQLDINPPEGLEWHLKPLNDSASSRLDKEKSMLQRVMADEETIEAKDAASEQFLITADQIDEVAQAEQENRAGFSWSREAALTFPWYAGLTEYYGKWMLVVTGCTIGLFAAGLTIWITEQDQELVFQQLRTPYEQFPKTIVPQISNASPNLNDSHDLHIMASDLNVTAANQPVFVASRLKQSSVKTMDSLQSDRGQTAMLNKTDHKEHLLFLGFQAWQQGELKEAEQVYRQVLENSPQQRDALLGLLAVSQMNGGDLSVVIGLVEQLSQGYPQDLEVRLALDKWLVEGSRLASLTETELKMASQGYAHSAGFSFQLGLRYAEQQRWSEARSAFYDAVSQEPQNLGYQLNLAISYDRLGKLALAIEHYQKTLELLNHGISDSSDASMMDRLSYLHALTMVEK